MKNPVYNLPKLEFIGGSSQTFKFQMQNMYGKPFNAEGCTATFSIVEYCNRAEVPLVKEATLGTGTTKTTSVATVQLDAADTAEMGGRYIYQLSIKNAHGEFDMPGQGIIDIRKNIHPDFVTG